MKKKKPFRWKGKDQTYSPAVNNYLKMTYKTICSALLHMQFIFPAASPLAIMTLSPALAMCLRQLYRGDGFP